MKLLLPIFRHFDGLTLLHDALSSHALFVGVLYDLPKVIRLKGRQDIEKIVPWRTFSFGKLIGKELHEPFVIFHHRENVLNTELLIMRNVNMLDFFLLEQMLLSLYDLLHEVLMKDGLVREVKLETANG